VRRGGGEIARVWRTGRPAEAGFVPPVLTPNRPSWMNDPDGRRRRRAGLRHTSFSLRPRTRVTRAKIFDWAKMSGRAREIPASSNLFTLWCFSKLVLELK
jgi:hypothetical protein